MGEPEFQSMSTSFDCVWLLETLNLFSAGVDKNSNVYVSTFHAMKGFYSMRQSPTETMEAYHSRFESAVATATLSKGNIFGHDKLSQYERDRGIVSGTDAAVKDGYLAVAFLENADSHRFSGLWTQLKNSMLLGHNDYPINLTATYDLLCNYKPIGATRRHDNSPVNVTFAQTTTGTAAATAATTTAGSPAAAGGPAPTPGNNGVLSASTFCYNCRLNGHIARFLSVATHGRRSTRHAVWHNPDPGRYGHRSIGLQPHLPGLDPSGLWINGELHQECKPPH